MKVRRYDMLAWLPGRSESGDAVWGTVGWGLVVLSVAAFVRAIWLLRGSAGLEADPAVLRSVQWMLALFAGVIGYLAGALLHRMGRVRAERLGALPMRRSFGVVDQLPDPLIAVDPTGCVRGGNLKARQLAGDTWRKGAPMSDVFPFLAELDLRSLLDDDRPQEQEVRKPVAQEDTVYRVRSYPVADLWMLLMSDITSETEEAEHREHEEQQQVIGRIAQGVAHDFNNILCAISGHAALMARSERLTEAEADSLTTIADEANRGAILARQLVDLSRPFDLKTPTVDLGAILQRSAAMLKKAIPHPDWQVVADAATVELYSEMPPSQLEQLFIRFGLQLTDEYEEPQTLHLLLRRPGAVSFGDVEPPCDIVVLIVVSHPDHPADLSGYHIDESPPLSVDGGGVIQSVVLALLDRYGGSLDTLINTSGNHGYRVCLRRKLERSDLDSRPGVDEPLDTLSGWNVLLARPAALRWNVTNVLLKEMGAKVKQVNNVVAALHELEQGPHWHAVLIDESLLGMDPEGTLRKSIRCQPDAAHVLLRSGEVRDAPLADQVASLERPVTLVRLRRTLTRAVRLAGLRSESASFIG